MNPMQSTQLMAGELMVDGRRIWRSAGFAAVCAILGLGLAGSFRVAAQEPDAAALAGQTNDGTAAEVLTRIGEMVQPDDSTQPEDTGGPDDLTATNGLPPADGSVQPGGPTASSNRFVNPNRTQNDDRRSRSRRSFRLRSGQSGGSGSAGDYSQSGDRSQATAAAGTNGGLSRLDYAAFKVIVDKNIFDPNRYARRPGDRGPRSPSKPVDSLTLVGTMTYEKGTFAFFDGTSSDYKKALKLNDLIAGHKITNITPNSVKLAAGTNEVALTVGMQLRREEDGPWSPAGQSGSYTAVPGSTSTNAVASTSSDAAASAAESDVIKRLRQRRGQD